jgi:autotransporter-associated beta strand protein
VWTNSSWYVPVPNLIAYQSGSQSFSHVVPVGDQTLWTIGTSDHGAFTGTSSATLSVGSFDSFSNMSMQGVVTTAGQIAIVFTPVSGSGPATIGIGQMREIAGVPLAEMQMITGSQVLVTHWAYMTPYNPATFTPPPPSAVIHVDVTSPQWRWTASTTWSLVSQPIFASTNPGTFKITNYNNGYFWGIGVGPQGSAVGNFTLLGSMTPEGNVLFNTLVDGTLTSLSGLITGDPATGAMALLPYQGSGPYGPVSTATVAVAPSAITAGSTFFLSDVGSTVVPAFTGGTLQVDTNGQTSAQNFTLNASGTNRIDQRGNSATFSGVFSDTLPGVPGSVTIGNSESGGRIVFSGANSYTGTTLIDAGATLAVDGSIVSPVTANGTLRGTGLIGGRTTIANGGTLAPGDSPGTLTFAAPVVMAPGATLQLDIDGTGTGNGAGNYSRVIVAGAGNSFTADGTLQPLLRGITPPASNNFTPSLAQQFNVIAAEGGVLGGFTSLTQPAGLAQGTRFDALYAPNTVNLVVTPASYGNLGQAGLRQTGNQSSVGRALDAVRPAAGLRMSGATASLFTPLYTLPGASIPQALEQLSPTIYGDVLLAARGTWRGFAEQVTGQLDARRRGSGSVATAPGPNGSTVWTSGFGELQQVASTDVPGFLSSAGGVMAGIDTALGAFARAGFAVGGGSTKTWANNGASGDGAALQVALYGEMSAGAFFLAGQAAYLVIDQAITRPMSAWSTATRGSGTLSGGGGQLAGGMRLVFGNWQIEPTVGMSVLALGSRGTTESGVGGPTQQINGQSLSSVQSLLAVPVGTQIALSPERLIHARGLVGWSHEFSDTVATTTGGFTAASSAQFSTVTAPVSRDALLLGLSGDVSLARGVSLFASVRASVSSQSSAESARVGIRATW